MSGEAEKRTSSVPATAAVAFPFARKRSEASYQPINNVAEASNAFATIINPYQCNRPIGDDSGRAGRNRTFRAQFVVEKGLRGITAFASWTWQSTPRLELVRPDGTKLIPRRCLYQREAIRKQGLQVIRFDVTKPYPGKWTLVAISPKWVSLAFNVWRTQEAPIALRPFKYVALGDSYLSGEGVEPYLGGGGHKCHRSSRAYAEWVQPRVYDDPLYKIASGGGKPGSFGGRNKYASDKNVRTDDGVTWAFWACSGAVTKNVLPASMGGEIQQSQKNGDGKGHTQLDSPSVDNDADLVTITIGGNDTGFADAVEYCFAKDCTVSWFESNHAEIIRGVVKRDLVRTFRAIGARMPRARILVLGYPQIFPKSAQEQTCWGLHQFLHEQDMLRRLGVLLNETIEQAVSDARTTAPNLEFVNVMNRFAGHEVCGDEGGWVIGLSSGGSFHPNEDGQRLGYAAAINDTLQHGGP